MAIRDAILCGHCAAALATTSCAGCKLEVCAACAADRKTCARPRALELRLGMGARLRAVDRTARWGLATTLIRSWARLDLDALSRTSFDVPYTAPQLLASGEVAGLITEEGIAVAFGVAGRRHDRVTGTLDRAERRILAVHGDEVWITDLDDHTIVGLRALSWKHTPFRRAVPSAVWLDHAGGRLACATYGEIAVIDVATREHIAAVRTGDVDIDWVAIAGDTLAARLARGGGLTRHSSELVVWSADGEHERWREPLGDPRRSLADLGGDGALAVAATDESEVLVIDTRAETVARLAGHTDGLSALRASDDGDRIVSGDFDNRVIVWDRGSGGFPTQLEPAALDER